MGGLRWQSRAESRGVPLLSCQACYDACGVKKSRRASWRTERRSVVSPGHKRLIVSFSLTHFAGVVSPGSGSLSAAKADRNNARLRALFPVARDAHRVLTSRIAELPAQASISSEMCDRGEGAAGDLGRSLAAVLTPTPGILVRTG